MKVASVLTVGQGVLGGAVAIRPGVAAAAVAGAGRPAPAWLARLLGMRMAAQSALVAVVGGDPGRERKARLAGAAVDALHAASMVIVSFRLRQYRRSALVSAAAAGVSSAAGVLAARAAPWTPAGVGAR